MLTRNHTKAWEPFSHQLLGSINFSLNDLSSVMTMSHQGNYFQRLGCNKISSLIYDLENCKDLFMFTEKLLISSHLL